MDFRELTVNDSEALLKAQMEAHQAGMYTALPGTIVSYNAAAMTVQVQPTVQGVVTDQTTGKQSLKTLPELPDVPVCFPRGGGFTLTFPIAKGDECLIVFSSRPYDAWWQSGGVQPPTDARMHDLSDGFAIIGPFSQATKIVPSTTAAELRSDDGAMSISLDSASGTMTFKAATSVVFETPLVTLPTGSITVPAGGVTATGIGLTDHHHVAQGATAATTGPVG